MRSYSTFKNRRAGCEEIPLFQGKEQRLRFAGAAVERYPMPKVRETQVESGRKDLRLESNRQSVFNYRNPLKSVIIESEATFFF